MNKVIAPPSVATRSKRDRRPRSDRQLAVVNAYGGLLERLVPRLETLLFNRLQRLESRVSQHESRYGMPVSAEHSKKPRRALDVDLSAGQPSVLLLGARLKADQQYGRGLLNRVTAILRGRLARG
ncbi:MAG TPA: hypothetical protein VHC22_18385 [Pirellulales bacterium]|nr:hypothetical protein [Pirellulales bacterium]